MRDVLKLMLIPIVGAAAVALIFILVVWGGSWQDEVINERGRVVGAAATRDLGIYPTIGPSAECSPIYDPVCGFDGATYDNACHAFQAGVEISYQGQCRS